MKEPSWAVTPPQMRLPVRFGFATEAPAPRLFEPVPFTMIRPVPTLTTWVGWPVPRRLAVKVRSAAPVSKMVAPETKLVLRPIVRLPPSVSVVP